MVLPLFAALDPRRTTTGTPFENVAEEVLNGLFCHYEPPVSEYAQHKAAKEVRKNPQKYTFSEVKKSASILRTSRLFRKRQAFATDEPADRSITASGGNVGNSKKAVKWRDEKAFKGIEGQIEGCAARHCDFLGFTTNGGGGLTDNLSPSAAQTHEPKMANEAPKPQSIIKQTPTTKEPLKDGCSSKVLYDDEGNPIGNIDVDVPFAVPPAPNGLSQLRQMARELDDGDDVYEPENYDQPSKRPWNKKDEISSKRSESPMLTSNPNHYDTPEQFEGSDRLSDRPSTPYRVRAPDVMSYQSGENSIIDQDGHIYPISPSKRSEVFSDLTMDPALRGRSRRAISPANTSEGVEVDMVPKAPPKSAIIPKPATDLRASLLSEVRGRKGIVVYDKMGNIVERRANLESKEVVKAKSSDTIPEVAASKTDETKESRKSSGGGSRRISGGINETGIQKLQKLPKTNVETNHTAEELEKTSFGKRDPTPRMSMEPPSSGIEELVSTDKGPLPPTPRRKSDTQLSSQGTRSDREDRQREEEIRARLSKAYMKESNKKKSTSGSRKKSKKSDRTVGTDDEIRAEVTTVGDLETENPNNYNTFEYLADEANEKEEEIIHQDMQPALTAISNTSTLSSIDERGPTLQNNKSEETAPKSKQSASSNSNRSEKLWKGWKKTLVHVKKLVNDIDEQRLPSSHQKARR
jgi:hypothetical protein